VRRNRSRGAARITAGRKNLDRVVARYAQDAGAPSRAPRTAILDIKPYFVNEEEVPRSGKLVTRSYQHARWLDGRTLTWIGRRVTTGRGEGTSGLAFDRAVDVPKS